MWKLVMAVLLAGETTMGADEAARKEAVDAAKAALSRDLKVDGDELALRKAIATEWPDASLGCPAKDRSYAQVLTPGYRVVLEVRGKVYSVHTGDGRAVRCDTLRKGPKLPEKTLDRTGGRRRSPSTD